MDQHALGVAIVGAGIGGLAAAISLSRVGCQVTVYEQANEFRETGTGLHLGPNGSRLLHSWGLRESLEEVAVRPPALEVRHWKNGETLVRRPMGQDWEEEYGAPYYTVHRADLHRVLSERADGALLRLDSRITALDDEPDGVRLHLADGSTATADVVIGADGVNSTVRRSLTSGDHVVYSGNSAFRGTVPVDALPTVPVDCLLVWPGPEVKLLCCPVKSGREVAFVAVVPDPVPRPASWSIRATVGTLKEKFADWNSDVVGMFDSVTDVGLWALVDHEPLERWSSGRTTLLGDAAHPMLPHHGQGASQAIEDAVALAHCLAGPAERTAAGRSARDKAAVAAALHRYEEIRRPHTRSVQIGSRGSGTLRLSSGPQAVDAGQDGPADAALGRMVEDVSWIHAYDVREALRDAATATEVLAARS
ncbi:FAD-dependent monooxygenase [Streptomyces sp. NPDC004838]